jgi:hypothetical protein
MGCLVTPKKSLEDIVAEYTEDLVAERRPRLAEDFATLNEDERSQLIAMLPIVRELKAAHREAQPPREEFIQRLDAFVRQEVARQSPLAPEAATSPDESHSAAERRSHLERILGAGRDLIQALTLPEVKARWRFAGVALLVLVLGLQVQLYLHVRRLEQQNKVLVAQLEQLSRSGSLAPLALPRDQQTTRQKGPRTPGSLSWDDLLTGVELRVRVEQRIGELEKEAATKTGRDREVAENLVRELRALLRPLPKP